MIKNILPSKSGNAENANKIIKTVKKLCKYVHMDGKDLLRGFCKLFYLRFSD